jgi:glycosyltransferase A (GT-A) superfamily protein (DUF2064 family)
LKNKTAVLIFANSAEKEAERKSFLSADVFSALNKQTLKTVEKSGLPYFHFSEKNQVGENFAERFANAIEAIYAKGFHNVITVGNDTPHLKTRHLVTATKNLATSDLVLGPSKDGGFYLMGLKKEHYHKETFLKLPWQTSKLHKSISNIIASKNLLVKFLEILKDIDVKEDIKQIIDSFKTIPLSILRLLHHLIFTSKTILSEIEINISDTILTQPFNKGSPSIFA